MIIELLGNIWARFKLTITYVKLLKLLLGPNVNCSFGIGEFQKGKKKIPKLQFFAIVHLGLGLSTASDYFQKLDLFSMCNELF